MNEGADTFMTTLSRGPGQSWGFRLQGGADFSTPLSVAMVNPGSVAEQYGVKAGDAVLQINGRSTADLEHDRAKEEIMRSGDSIQFLLQRGQVTIWKPQVTNISDLKPADGRQLPAEYGDMPYVQKTSLAAQHQPVHHIGSAHNRSARPFGAPASATPAAPSVEQYKPEPSKGLVNSQYNSPINMYSSDNVSSTYQAHADQLSDQVARVVISESSDGASDDNVKSTTNGQALSHTTLQTDRSYLTPSPTNGNRAPSPNSVNVRRSPSPQFTSPTLMAIMAEEGKDTPNKTGFETEQSKDYVQYKGYSNPGKQSRSFRLLQAGLDAVDNESTSPITVPAPAMPSGIRSVRAPVNKPPSERKEAQHMTCKKCGTLIIGVFVRIQGEPIHPECFKCATCGMNLKNQGHFIVDKEMYCETHARTAAQSQAPGPNMVATPVYR